ncbi:MAG: extracellular solute-binding protein [Chloroflexi bacterium]|nr:extracellular solute-binding protein [Chloroflexota bacterium]
MRRSYLTIVLLASILAACGPQPGGVPPKAPEAAATEVNAPKQGWEVEWDKTVAEARKEGKVSIITQWAPDARAAVIGALKEKFGIDVEFTVVAKTPEATTKLVTERRAGLYLTDVIGLGAIAELVDMKGTGIPAPIEPMLMLPEVKDPKNWMGGVLFMDQGKLVIPFSAEFSTYVGRHTELVKEGEIQSYSDLLDPKWKGKIVMSDPTLAGSGNAWVSFMTTLWGLDKTKDYLRQFVRQEPVLSRDLRLQAEWLARGKYPVSVAPNQSALLEFKNAGAPVAFVRIKEGGRITASGSCVGVPSGQLPHPNAAKVFVNWLLTKEGQTVFARGVFRPSARVDVPLPDGYQGLTPLPGEPIVVQNEAEILRQGELMEIAKEIFAPLLK